MKQSTKPMSLMLRAAYSNQALKSLYNLRKSLAPETENRTRLSMGIAAISLLFLMGFLVSMTFIRKDPKEKLISQGSLIVPSAESLMWSQPINDIRIDRVSGVESLPILLSATIDTAVFKPILDTEDTFVVVLPSFSFKTLDVVLNGDHAGHFAKNTTTYVYVDRRQLIEHDSLSLTISIVPTPDQDRLVRQNDPQPLLVTNVKGFRDYIQSSAVINSGRGGFAGLMARIVMAAFVLVLFLFVDGSPESLGMALFLGFEALALTTAFGWLPSAYDAFIVHYLSQMGDIFRLYFFLQLARVVDKRLGPWFWWGTALSVPYGLLRHYELSLGLQSLQLIPIWRDIIIGFAGAFICLRAASAIVGQNLSWRVAALVIAAIGSLQQVVGPIGSLIPAMGSNSVFIAASNIFTPLSVYLLVLSVFVNISTLEKRVRALSQVAISAKEMEREMVLGQAVQQSFLRVPPTLPKTMGVVCHHEPAVFVSGDIYYVHWDERREVLTMLLSDITGHGVQAALKAAVCLTLAESLWVGGEFRRGDPADSRLSLYNLRVCSFLSKMANAPETLAMVGMEYDCRTEELIVYRVNGVFPMVIEPRTNNKGEPRLEVRTLVIPNRETIKLTVKPGMSLVMLSDGYIGGSRTQFHLQRYLNEKLQLLDEPLDADGIKELLRTYADYDDSHDDRTILVFQAPEKAAQAQLRA